MVPFWPLLYLARPMGGDYYIRGTIWVLRVFSKFFLKNHARVVEFSYVNFAPLNLYPTYNQPQSPRVTVPCSPVNPHPGELAVKAPFLWQKAQGAEMFLGVFKFSKHLPSGPMLSISRNVRLSVRLCVCVCVHF